MHIPDEALDILKGIERKHSMLSGMSAKIILIPSGAGELVFEDELRNKIIAVVDFDEGDDLIEAARRLQAQIAITEP